MKLMMNLEMLTLTPFRRNRSRGEQNPEYDYILLILTGHYRT